MPLLKLLSTMAYSLFLANIFIGLNLIIPPFTTNTPTLDSLLLITYSFCAFSGNTNVS